jgi:hypothetical protein
LHTGGGPKHALLDVLLTVEDPLPLPELLRDVEPVLDPVLDGVLVELVAELDPEPSGIVTARPPHATRPASKAAARMVRMRLARAGPVPWTIADLSRESGDPRVSTWAAHGRVVRVGRPPTVPR